MSESLKLVIFPNSSRTNIWALLILNEQFPKHLMARLPKSLSLIIKELTMAHFKLSNSVSDIKYISLVKDELKRLSQCFFADSTGRVSTDKVCIPSGNTS